MKWLVLLLITWCIFWVWYIDKQTHEIEIQAKLLKDYSFVLDKKTLDYERKKFENQMKYFDSLIIKK